MVPMAALLSTDILISAFISSLAFILLLMGFFLQLGSYSSQLSIAQNEFHAMLFADKLLFSCGPEMGLSKCDPWGADSNVLLREAIASFATIGEKKISEHFGLGGYSGWEISLRQGDSSLLFVGNFSRSNSSICIKRLAILDGKAAILSACIN